MSVKMKPINFLALVALAMTSPFVVAQEAKTVVNYHTTVERMFNLHLKQAACTCSQCPFRGALSSAVFIFEGHKRDGG